MKDIIDLLKELPQYIPLFYPGYITIYLYHFFGGKSLEDSKWNLGKAVFLSYFYGVLSNAIIKKLDIETNLNFNLLLLMLAILVGTAGVKIRFSSWFSMLLKWIEKDSIYDMDEFEVLRNPDRSAWVCIYLKGSNVVYEGSLREVSLESDNKKYICLSGYYKYLLKEDGKPQLPYIEEFGNDNEEKVIIYYDDIERIEKRKT